MRPPPDWLSPEQWQLVTALAAASPTLSNLPSALAYAEQAWRHWLESESPEHEAVPEYGGKLSLVER
jgi:hypothetical protein